MSRRLAALLALAGLALALAAPAAAQPQAPLEVRLKDADTATQGHVQATVALSGSAFEPDQALPAGAFTATIDGRPARVNGARLLRQTGREVAVVLAVDTSRSMLKQNRIEAAKAAALRFVGQVRPGTRVGVVAFADKPRSVVALTADRAAAAGAIRTLAAAGHTALLDAVVTASGMLAAEPGQRNIVLLSDGDDDSSGATVRQAVKAAHDQNVSVYTIALSDSVQVPATLRSLSAGTGGASANATPQELNALYDRLSQELNSQYTIDVEVPPGTPNVVDAFQVTVTAGGASASDAVPLLLKAGAPPPPKAPAGPLAARPLSRLQSPEGLYIAAGLALVSLLLFALAVATARPAEGKDYRQLRERLSQYSLIPAIQEARPSVFGVSQAAGRATQLAEVLVRRGNLEEALAGRIESAGLKLRVAEYVVIHLACAFGLPLVLLGLTRNLVVAVLGVVVGTVAPLAFLRVRAARRWAAFEAQLPDTLQLLAGALQAGHSLLQAIDTVVQEAGEPMSSEFQRVLTEARLGMPIEEALEGMARRMRSTDFSWTVMAVSLQRQIGGNLAEVLGTVAATIRERYALKRQVRALSAEGRLSSIILSLLPFLMFIGILLINPTFLAPLFTTPIGLVMMGVAVVLMAFGILWLRKITEIKV